MFISTHSALAVGVGIAIGLLLGTQRRLSRNQEQIMAKFEGLDADIAELKTTVGDTADRVEAAFATLGNDDADQAEIEQARAEVRTSIEALRAIAKPAEEPTPEPEPAPEPTPEF